MVLETPTPSLTKPNVGGSMMARAMKHNVANPRNDLTVEEVRSHFEYDASKGVLIRKTRSGANGWVSKTGYRYRTFKGVHYKEHRLVWLVCNGKWPEGQIDHINGDKSDNRIENLQDVSGSRNQWKVKQSPGSTGVVGVSMVRGRYQATIRHHGKKLFLGYHDSLEEAAKARAKAEAQLRA